MVPGFRECFHSLDFIHITHPGCTGLYKVTETSTLQKALKMV